MSSFDAYGYRYSWEQNLALPVGFQYILTRNLYTLGSVYTDGAWQEDKKIIVYDNFGRSVPQEYFGDVQHGISGLRFHIADYDMRLKFHKLGDSQSTWSQEISSNGGFLSDTNIDALSVKGSGVGGRIGTDISGKVYTEISTDILKIRYVGQFYANLSYPTGSVTDYGETTSWVNNVYEIVSNDSFNQDFSPITSGEIFLSTNYPTDEDIIDYLTFPDIQSSVHEYGNSFSVPQNMEGKYLIRNSSRSSRATIHWQSLSTGYIDDGSSNYAGVYGTPITAVRIWVTRGVEPSQGGSQGQGENQGEQSEIENPEQNNNQVVEYCECGYALDEVSGECTNPDCPYRGDIVEG